MSPQVEFEAQPNAELHDRFVDALVTEFTASRQMMEDPTTRPGAERKHIFDFEDGVRIIVSRDVLEAMTAIHFSISIEQGQIYDALSAEMGKMDDATSREDRVVALENLVTERVLPRIHDLAGFVIPLEVLGIHGIVYHVLGPTKEQYNELARKAGAREIS